MKPAAAAILDRFLATAAIVQDKSIAGGNAGVGDRVKRPWTRRRDGWNAWRLAPLRSPSLVHRS